MSKRHDISHAGARRLVERKFGPAGLEPSEASALRTHLAGCGECRSHYDLRVAVLRAVAGVGPAVPLGVESRLLMEETFARLIPRRQPAVRGLDALRFAEWALGGAAAVMLAVLVAYSPLSRQAGVKPHQDNLLASRGALDELPEVGIGLSGVDFDGREYEVVDSDGACLADGLRFYVTSREADYGHYFLFGLLDDSDVLWYFPLPEERTSYVIPADSEMPYMVPFELELHGRHRVGSLTVYGLFGSGPVLLEDVASAVERVRRDGALVTAGDLAEALGSARGAGVLATELTLNIIDCGVTK